jgi:septal ring factor EnvC (AmiA/AmiB activator)
VVPAALLPICPSLPPPSSSVDTSPTDARVNQQSAEIQRLSDELTSRNRLCEALQSQISSLTADFEKARFTINELDSAMEVLNSELATSRAELECTKTRFSHELADRDAMLLAIRSDRDAAVGRVDSVNKWIILIISIVNTGNTTALQRKFRFED